MRRVALLFAVALLASGCATSDRFAYQRGDPFIWFLSGMPAPYDLNWPPNTVPDLPVLNPPDYVPPPALEPLDYPRGWNPDHPPLIAPDAGLPTPADTPASAPPQPVSCDASCAVPDSTEHAGPAVDDGAAARPPDDAASRG